MYGFPVETGEYPDRRQYGCCVTDSRRTEETATFIGEIFTVDKNLIPNSQRNYFNETPARIKLEEQLRVFFYEELHRLYHVANETKNHYRKLEAYNEAVA